MRFIFLVLMVAGLAGCTLMRTGEHDWLAEPERTGWNKVDFTAYGRRIVFFVPNKAKGIGMKTKARSVWGTDYIDHPVVYPQEMESWNYNRPFTFYWDRAWGGFYKRSEWLFTMDVVLNHREGEDDLLSRSADLRREQVYERRRSRAARANRFSLEEFLEVFECWIYDSPTVSGWVAFEYPRSDRVTIEYEIPLDDRFVLNFHFYLSKDHMGTPASEEWLDSRIAMIHKIMETVHINPPPFPVSSAGMN